VWKLSVVTVIFSNLSLALSLQSNPCCKPSVHTLTPSLIPFALVYTQEIAISKIPNAMTEDAFKARIQEDPDWLSGCHDIVPYCTIGYRSAKFAQSLKIEHPELSVYNMGGSILAWVHVGGKVINPEGYSVKALHVYGDAWDIAPLDYSTQTFV